MSISVYYMYCVCGFVIHVFTIVSLDIIGIIVGIRLDPHIPKSALFVRTTVSVYARQIILALVCDPCFVITNLKYFGTIKGRTLFGACIPSYVVRVKTNSQPMTSILRLENRDETMGGGAV